MRELFLGDLSFNAFGPLSADAPAALEPDLAAAQESIRWADHLVFVYPIWWGTIPALRAWGQSAVSKVMSAFKRPSTCSSFTASGSTSKAEHLLKLFDAQFHRVLNLLLQHGI